jgi:hypothetical protein
MRNHTAAHANEHAGTQYVHGTDCHPDIKGRIRVTELLWAHRPGEHDDHVGEARVSGQKVARLDHRVCPVGHDHPVRRNVLRQRPRELSAVLVGNLGRVFRAHGMVLYMHAQRDVRGVCNDAPCGRAPRGDLERVSARRSRVLLVDRAASLNKGDAGFG